MKQKFDLSLWLKDKSRKICTRDGRPARIVCWDKKDSEYPIVGLVSNENGLKEKEGCCSFTINGKAWGEACYDLFFADDEEELTEFEKELEMMMVSFSNGNLGSDVRKEMPKQKLHSYAHRLLEIAEKQLKQDKQWEK